MLTINDLQERLGEWQTRRLLYAIRPLLHRHRKGGQGRSLLIDPQAIGLLERAAQLHRSGVLLQDLSKTLAKELGQDTSDGHRPQLQESENSQQELIATLRDQILDLRQERDRLLELLEETQAQLWELQQLALPQPRRSWLWRLLWR